MILEVISRVAATHQLVVLGLYAYVMRYLQPHQRDVTKILALVAQSCHAMVPPDALEPVLMCIANHFVSDTCSVEVMTVGLNAIREISSRCPLAMTETLLQDLTEYKKYRHTGVMNAARSLIGLFRKVNPHLLRRRDLGKDAAVSTKNFKVPVYGDQNVVSGIEGMEVSLRFVYTLWGFKAIFLNFLSFQLLEQMGDGESDDNEEPEGEWSDVDDDGEEIEEDDYDEDVEDKDEDEEVSDDDEELVPLDSDEELNSDELDAALQELEGSDDGSDEEMESMSEDEDEKPKSSAKAAASTSSKPLPIEATKVNLGQVKN